MHPVASLRAPISSVAGSCNTIRKLCASPRAIERTNLKLSNGSIAGSIQSLPFPAAPMHHKRKISQRLNCINNASCTERPSDGIHALKTTLDNLTKLWTNLPINVGVRSIESSDLGDLKSEEAHLTSESGCASIQNLSIPKIPQSPTYSPKQKLGERWEEYQGCNNWEGLLDPLDENLRREIVKYGDFVQATYSAFDFDPQSKSYASCKYTNHSLLNMAGLKNSGYKVTRHIYATSSIRLPQWLTALASSKARGMAIDGQWMTKRTAWVGFVAVCDDKTEIERLGRRDIVVAYRGTATPFEWAENLKTSLTPAWNDPQAKVESGFWSLYTCKGPTGQSASDQVMDEVRRLAGLYNKEKLSITVTGHSLGAALSLLTAYQLGAEFTISPNTSNNNDNHSGDRIPVTVFSFGGPRVGNRAFGSRLEENGSKVLRVVNTHDVITKVPGVPLNERVCCDDKVSKIVGLLEKMPWAYCHVGTELRLNNRHSPYLKPNADVACCHDLEAYLHLVDGFLSSSTPFRPSAKRSIVGLLINQKSNVLLKPAASKWTHLRPLTKGHGRIEFNKHSYNKSYYKDDTPSPNCVGS